MRTILCIAALSMWTALAAAAEEHRQLGPHEHGHGSLNIAVENTHVAMELDVPGDDIVGFEHDAATPEEKQAMSDGVAKLSDALKLFTPAPAAGCKPAGTKVLVVPEPEEEKADADAKEAGHEEAGHRHSEFHVDYSFNCARPSALTGIEFGYFNAFPRGQVLEVAIITPKGQSSFEVTRDNPKIDLAGLM